MRLSIGIVGFISPDEKRMIAEAWESIQGNQKNPNSSLWFIELGGDDAFPDSEKLKEFLDNFRFSPKTKEVLLRLKEFYEPLTKFSLEAFIPKRLICGGKGEFDVGFVRYYLQAAASFS